MRRIAVVGADTKLGEIVLNRALAAGYAVHAYGSNLGKVAQRYNENLSAFHGELESGKDLEAAVHGARFVICGLEPHKPVMTAFMAKLLPLLKTPPLGRLVFVSQFGAGDSAKQKAEESGRFARLTSWMHKDFAGDFGRAEGLLRVSKLPYVILRPVSLVDDPHAREVVATEPTGKAPPPVARGALAKFLLEVLTEPGWDRREMTVGAFTDKSDSDVFKRTRLSSMTTPGMRSPLLDAPPPAASPAPSEPPAPSVLAAELPTPAEFLSQLGLPTEPTEPTAPTAPAVEQEHEMLILDTNGHVVNE